MTDHNVTKLDDADLTTIDVTDAAATWTAPGGAPADARLGYGFAMEDDARPDAESTIRR